MFFVACSRVSSVTCEIFRGLKGELQKTVLTMFSRFSRSAALFLFVAAVGSNAEERPNVLMIVADDLGWSDVGWHRGLAKTPRMDALVGEGVELDRHYVQPVCTPTRTALMSGRYPGVLGRIHWHHQTCARCRWAPVRLHPRCNQKATSPPWRANGI